MTRLTWPAVGLIGVLGGIAVALATLAHWDAGGILGVLGILGGIGGGAAVGGAVAGKVDDVHAQTTAIGGRLNGELDARLAAANAKQLRDIEQMLSDRGIGR